MLGVLKAILCAILDLAYWISDLFMMMFNAIIAAIAAFIGDVVLPLLPQFPDPPEDPPGGVIGYANWMFPIGGAVTILVAVATLFGSFLIWRTVLRWAKALS